MITEKFKSFINIALKAGYVIIGGEKLKNYNKKLYLILYDSDIKNNTKKILDKIKEKNIPMYLINSLSTFVHIENCKIIGIKNKNISDIIIEEINK